MFAAVLVQDIMRSVMRLRLRWRACRNGAAVVLITALASLVSCAANADDVPLALERTIRLKDVSGRIDHLALDAKRRRLVIAELGNDTVDVVDLATGKLVHRFEGLTEPQGVAYLPGPDLIVIANGGDGSVDFFAGGDFSSRNILQLGDDADNVRRDPRNGHVLVGHDAGMLAIVDPTAGKILLDIALPGHPEGFQLDPATDRVYVNIPDAKQIAVVDLAAGKQIATWRFQGLSGNFPLAIDGTESLLAAAFRSPPQLALIDSKTGKVTWTYQTCGDADDVFFDPNRQRIYVSCGAGVVDIFVRHSTTAQPLARVSTSSGARTSLFSPEFDRLFVAARAGLLESEAAILVFKPKP